MKGKPTYEELMKHVFELQTRVQKLEKKLEENREKTEKLKSRFLSSISHELRTPMNAILGFSNLMIDKNLPHEKREEYMEHINMSSNNLLQIVDSMIDVSLLEINELKINKDTCNLDALMKQIYHYFNIDKYKRGKDNIAMLLNKKKRENDFMIYTDSYRLTQVLSNLLQNALKFTNKGIIEFGYFEKNDRQLQFFVRDSGKGVIVEKARYIFNKFEKLEEAQEENPGGLGLGLSLSKGIINLLGGDIWVESNIFNGATFNFTIDYVKNSEKIQKTSKKINFIIV